MKQALKEFIAQQCIVHESAIVMVADFVGAFRAWAQARGFKPPLRSEVVGALEAMGYAIGRKDDRLHVVGLAFDSLKYVVNEGKVVRTTIRAKRLPAAPCVTKDRATV